MVTHQSSKATKIVPILTCAEPTAQYFNDQDDFDWAGRSEFWRLQIEKSPISRTKRQKTRRPLILVGYSVLLKIERNSLFIRNGLTHYPQKPETFRFFKGEPNLPERIILLDCSGSISFDVISWCVSAWNIDPVSMGIGAEN